MKKTIFTIGISLCAIFIHCDDGCVCDSGPPLGELEVRLTINDDNPDVQVNIFRGRIEDADTLFTETINESTIYYDLEAGRYYSATATYLKGARTIVAVDGRRMHISTDDCNCEYAESIRLDLRLKD